jgi:hypothetical protein
MVESDSVTRQVALSKFFTYLSAKDKVLLGVGTLSAILAGAILPSISLVMGNVAAVFSGSMPANPVEPQQSMLQIMGLIVGVVIGISISIFAFAYLFFAFWQHLAENITTDLRKRYLKALLE